MQAGSVRPSQPAPAHIVYRSGISVLPNWHAWPALPAPLTACPCPPTCPACLARPPCSEKIVVGRVEKIAKEMALMEQQFIKDTSKTVAVS